MKIFALLLLSATAACAGSPGSSIPQRLAVAAVIGEAGGESFSTQVAVACAIRNRGNLHGVYGVSNPVVQKATPRVIARAQAAWNVSAQRDLVRGCQYFGCAADAPRLLAYGLKPVCKSGAITFYRG